MTPPLGLPSDAVQPLEGAASRRDWNLSRGKRCFDVVLAVVLLVLAAPLMAAVALVVRLSSRGPILFRQTRSGKDGRDFHLLKFRTMFPNAEQQGPTITRAGDSRITGVGRWLRRWKLDELPQLVNVLRGEMSFVGPRPDLPEYLQLLDASQREILRQRPGITGLATLFYRNEEELLASVPPAQLKHYYCTQLLPLKARIDLGYGRTAGLGSDLKILLRTFLAIFS